MARFKVRETDNSTERLICVGLIVSDRIVADLAPILAINTFTARYTKYIASWCLDYYKQFECAPKLHIQDIFEVKKRNELDEDSADLIESLLISLNDQLMNDENTFNEEYILSQAEQYIKAQAIKMTCEDAIALVSNGRIVEAEAAMVGFRAPQRPTAEGEDVLSLDFWSELEEENEVLFRLPRALDDLLGPIERDSFWSFIAPEKRGKSWWLSYMAFTAVKQRCNVAFFSIGDMTRKQVRRRFRHLITGKSPRKAPKTVLKPILDCYHNQYDSCPLDEETSPILLNRGNRTKVGTLDDFPDHQVCTKCSKGRDMKYFIGHPWYEEVDPAAEVKELDDVLASMLRMSKGSKFRLFTYPPATVNIKQIEAQLDILAQKENFIADVIIIDYADLLAPEEASKKFDARNQINYSWMSGRRVSQERNCAVIWATQASKEAQKNAQVETWDTSEDKRKIGHITNMVALNQTPAEKKAGIMRISNLATRDSDFDIRTNVTVLQSLALGRPVLTCYLTKPLPESKKNKKGKDED